MPTADTTINPPDAAAVSPLDAPIQFTLFADPYAKTKAEETQSLRQFAETVSKVSADSKGELPWIKMATFGDKRTEKDSLRQNANVLRITGTESDYDGEELHPEEAAAMLQDADLAAAIYTSPSHTDATPRWRVLCPLSGPMHPSERTRLLARVNGALGGVLSIESFTLSQSYYYGNINGKPPVRTILVEGRYLDQADELDANALGKPRTKPTPASSTTPVAASAQGTLARKVLRSTEIGNEALRVALSHLENVNETHPHILTATRIVKYFVTSGDLDESYALAVIERGADVCARAVSGRPTWDGEVQQAYDSAESDDRLDLEACGFSSEFVERLRLDSLERDFPDAIPFTDEEKERIETSGADPDDVAQTLKALCPHPDAGMDAEGKAVNDNTPLVYAYGENPYGDRKWLIHQMLPETGVALLSGQWGIGKTFTAIDLAACGMFGTPFAHHTVDQQRGVMLLAAEGEAEVSDRLRAAIEVRPEAAGKPVPFVWADKFPLLLAHDAVAQFKPVIDAARTRLDQIGTKLGLIILDTMAAGAGWDNENDAAEGQKAMNLLRNIGRHYDCLVVAIDHYGKDAGSGTRGTTAKESAADAVIALIGDRQPSGKILNSRMAIRKARGAIAGDEYPYDLTRRKIGTDDQGRDITTCTVTWGEKARGETATETAAKSKMLSPREAKWHSALQNIMNGRDSVTLDEWLAEGVRLNLADAIGPEDTRTTKEAKRKKFTNPKSDLVVAGWIAVDGETVRDLRPGPDLAGLTGVGEDDFAAEDAPPGATRH